MTTTTNRQALKSRPILHVRITDDSGTELADVDAQSTADALAYFLRSRKIAFVTEAGVKQGVEAAGQNYPSDTETIVFEQRCPILGTLERQLMAEVH